VSRLLCRRYMRTSLKGPTDTNGNDICYQFGAHDDFSDYREWRARSDAISSRKTLEPYRSESFDVVGRSTGPSTQDERKLVIS
jgi:hypothetical protein